MLPNGYKERHTHTQRRMHQILSNKINKSIDNSLYNFAIILKSENKVIGGTQLTNIDWHNGTAGGGIWISEKYWGHGYGTEASGLELNMHLKN